MAVHAPLEPEDDPFVISYKYTHEQAVGKGFCGLTRLRVTLRVNGMAAESRRAGVWEMLSWLPS